MSWSFIASGPSGFYIARHNHDDPNKQDILGKDGVWNSDSCFYADADLARDALCKYLNRGCNDYRLSESDLERWERRIYNILAELPNRNDRRKILARLIERLEPYDKSDESP